MATAISVLSWPKTTYYLLWGADTNLDVVKFAEAGAGIQFAPFKEKAPDGIEWLFALLQPELV